MKNDINKNNKKNTSKNNVVKMDSDFTSQTSHQYWREVFRHSVLEHPHL